MEIWKEINGYEGLYEVSNLGRIKRLSGALIYKTNNKRTEECIMKKIKCSDGYVRINLRNKDERKTLLVSRIVAINFIDNPFMKKEVNHIDGDKTNNTVENLEWTTRKENAEHAAINGLMSKGEKHGVSKLKEFEVKDIRKLYKNGGISQTKIAKKYSVTQHTVWCIIKNITWVDI